MVAAFLAAFQTLTRIPVPSPRSAPDRRILGWSAVFYPVVGGVMAAVAILLSLALSGVLPRGLLALLVLSAWALLTGVLHEDGLADCADALGSQRTREGALRVLKDSAVGSYGTVALILATLLRWQGLAQMSNERWIPALVAAAVAPRAGAVCLAYWAGPATEGLGGEFARSLTLMKVLITLVIGAGLVAVVDPRWAVASLLANVALAAAFTPYFRLRLGGVTGDCLGALIQLGEIAVLLLLLIVSDSLLGA